LVSHVTVGLEKDTKPLRIFPEGAEEWGKPLGKVFFISAAILAAIALMVFIRQEYIWHKWPIADGVVIDSQLVTSKGESGMTLCSASYKVKYSIKGTDYTADDDQHASSSDCAAWQSRVSSAKDSHRPVLYDPGNPHSIYVDPGYNFNFLGMPFVFLFLSGAFALAGVVGWRISDYMVRHNIRLP
jgi:hypothetical protein